MYVRDIMTEQAVTARPRDRAADVAEGMARRHVNTVYVLDGSSLLGKVTQTTLLKHVFPTNEQFYEDLTHAIDFEETEKRVKELSSLEMRDIMVPVELTATLDLPVMKVAAWMVLREASCVPVVDSEGAFQGVVSRGDIFYATVNRELEPTSRHDRVS